MRCPFRAISRRRAARKELQHDDHQDDQERKLRHRSRDGSEVHTQRSRKEQVQHDAGVDALARDLASRTPWTVRAAGSRRFRRPPVTAGRPPDVFCEVPRGAAICFEDRTEQLCFLASTE